MSNPTPDKKAGEHSSNPHKRKRRKSDHGHSGTHEMTHDESNWLVSYADMMTLLFGFFVLMYAFSRIDTKKFEVVRKDVARYFGGQVKDNPAAKKLEQEVKDVITHAGLDKSVELIARDSELELRFQGTLHFVSGTANLSKDSSFVLSKLIDLIKRSVKADSVTVEGHTDDEPIYSALFPSNWELSSARASTVVREFEKYGFDPSKLTAKGFGSSRPLLPNRDSKGDRLPDNQEINRRVIVTIGFSREIEDAIRAMKTNQFVSADAPEIDKDKARTSLVRDGEGEPTWREKVTHDLGATQEKLKLAEERLKETEEKNRAARNLADMQGRLKSIEEKIDTSEKETQNLATQLKAGPAARKPASKPVKAAPAPKKSKVVAPSKPAAAAPAAPKDGPVTKAPAVGARTPASDKPPEVVKP